MHFPTACKHCCHVSETNESFCFSKQWKYWSRLNSCSLLLLFWLQLYFTNYIMTCFLKMCVVLLKCFKVSVICTTYFNLFIQLAVLLRETCIFLWLLLRVYHQVTSFFISRGAEWYLEKCGSWKILAGSRNLGRVFDKSRSLVFSWFVFTFLSLENFHQRVSGSDF